MNSKVVDIGTARKAEKPSRNAEFIKHLVFWPVVACVVIFATRGVISDNGRPKLNAVHPISTTENGKSVVTVKRDSTGHFIFLGKINREPVKFLLDTGATNVAIPKALSKHLSLVSGRQMQTRTANGRALSYQTTLGSISVGNIVLNDIEGSIAPGLENDVILLGMSFLKHVELVQNNSQLVLTY